MSVTASTLPLGALPQTPNVSITTSTRIAGNLAMVRTAARNRMYQQVLGSHPKCLHYKLWNIETSPMPTIAEWSECALPLPHPPLSELSNSVALTTISENPSLFCIVTLINITCFTALLSDHPNCPFVESVCTGLQEGFWPWVDMLKNGYPITFDGTRLVMVKGLPNPRGTWVRVQWVRVRVEIIEPPLNLYPWQGSGVTHTHCNRYGSTHKAPINVHRLEF